MKSENATTARREPRGTLKAESSLHFSFSAQITRNLDPVDVQVTYLVRDWLLSLALILELAGPE